jgi:hypothetical protein
MSPSYGSESVARDGLTLQRKPTIDAGAPAKRSDAALDQHVTRDRDPAIAND